MTYNPWSDPELDEYRDFKKRKEIPIPTPGAHLFINTFFIDTCSDKLVFKGGLRVLELGCESGATFRLLRKKISRISRRNRTLKATRQFEYTGIEINRRAARMGNRMLSGYNNCEVIKRNIEELPWSFEDNQYDICFADSIYSLMKNPYEVIMESLRVSRKVFFYEFGDCIDREAEAGFHKDKKWKWMDESFKTYVFSIPELFRFAESNKIKVTECGGSNGAAAFILEKEN